MRFDYHGLRHRHRALLFSINALALVVTSCSEDPASSNTSFGAGLTEGIGLDTTEGLDGGAASGGGIKLDLSSDSGEPPGCGGEGQGGGGLQQIAFSNIWIANSPEGTVSRIDTRTGTELARYATGATSASDPSRTTVNLVGDIAALNRGEGGSIVKIAAEQERCIDRNGDGVIQTSSGADDVLPWDQDECVIWSKPLHAGARAAAWDSGNDPESDECTGEPSLWVSALDANSTVHVWRLAGDTGDEEDSTTIPNWDGQTQWGGFYGGAVDRGRNFWAIGKKNKALFRIDFETMDVERWDVPGVSGLYGIAMDKEGNPYVTAEFDSQLLRFDAATNTWEQIASVPGTLRGLAVDPNGDAWIATNNVCGLAHYEHASGIVTPITIPECNIPVGVSIDVDGFVWVVDQWAGSGGPPGRAHKLNATTHAVEITVTGLNTPYTYSDMTGAGLDLVSFPPQG